MRRPFNRKMYKEIKKMERTQMESFFNEVFAEGVKAGATAAVNSNAEKATDVNAIMGDIAAVLNISFGIGEKRFAKVEGFIRDSILTGGNMVSDVRVEITKEEQSA